MIRAGLVTLMGKLKNACRISVGNLKGGDHFEDLGMKMKILLKRIIKG
jgi:hypothetical protein